jgi:hypothetical protein
MTLLKRLRRPARHRGAASRGSATTATVAGAAGLAAVALVTGGVTLAVQAGGDDTCSGRPQRLTVLVAPEVGDAVRAAGDALAQRSGMCLLVSVTEQAPADAAAAIVRGTGQRPEVWIPDSSTWTRPVAAAGVRVPAPPPSVALSPIVFAVDRPVAARLGWPGRRLEIPRLVRTGDRAGGPSVRLGLPDPARSAAAVGGILALERVFAGRASARGGLAVAVRSAVTGLDADPAGLLRRVERDGTLAVPVSEQALVAYGSGAVAAYPVDARMSLDYPFVVLASDPGAGRAAERLLAALRGGPGAARLRADGFRDARGAAGDATRAATTIDPAYAPTRLVPAARDVDRALQTVRLIRLRSRLLAVIDVSGSMGEAVNGSGRTRLELTKDAAALGLAAYPDDADVGLWVFATGLAGRTDHRQLVPIGPLGPRADGRSGRTLLVRALSDLRHVPDGGTGLYDTTLAAVRAVRAGWDPERVNAVLLLTDGRNDDRRSITLAQLLKTLRRERDPDRPVPVISIAYGEDSDVAALGAISRATGGTRYLAEDPGDIQDVLFDAVGRRPCRPRC